MMKRVTAIALGVLVVVARCAAQDSIVLRPNTMVEAVRAITLGDVAELKGTEASKHAGAVVADEVKARVIEGGTLLVEVATVRAALSKAGIKWGSVALSGGTCRVSMGAPTKPVAAGIATPMGTSVRDHVASRLAQQLGVAVADLQLTFDADRSGILDIPTAGRSVTVTPTGTSERVPLTIRVYEDAKLVTEGSARVVVRVRLPVMVSRGTIARGVRITQADVAEEMKWISPTTQAAPTVSVVGAAARTRIEPGTVLLARDVETPALIRKGDLIAVDSVVGGVVIRMNNARALQDGRDGEEIMVEQAASLAATDKANGRRGKAGTVRVKVCGPGRAMVAEAK